MQDVKFGLAGYEGDGLFTIDFPAFKDFTIKARQTVVAWFWPVTNTEVELGFKDFDLDFQTRLVLDPNGYLDPIVLGCDINFGESYFVSDDWFEELIIFQFVHFSTVVIHNTAWLMGQFMFTELLGPVLDKYLNHYQ